VCVCVCVCGWVVSRCAFELKRMHTHVCALLNKCGACVCVHGCLRARVC
jgi:hypothetical protein